MNLDKVKEMANWAGRGKVKLLREAFLQVLELIDALFTE